MKSSTLASAAAASSHSVPHSTIPTERERVSAICRDIQRSVKGNLSGPFALKTGGHTPGGKHVKLPKLTHKNLNSSYATPWYSRPFQALVDGTVHDYCVSNIIDFTFSHVMQYIDQDCIPKVRLAQITGIPFFLSKEIGGFKSREIIFKEVYNSRLTGERNLHLSTCRFLAQAVLIGDADFNRNNSGVAREKKDSLIYKSRYKRYDLEFAGSFDSPISISGHDLYIPTKNHFKFLLLNFLSDPGFNFEISRIISTEFAKEAGILNSINLDPINEILIKSLETVNNFIITSLSPDERGAALSNILNALHDHCFGTNVPDGSTITLEDLVDKIIIEMKTRQAQLAIWRQFIDQSAMPGINATNLEEHLTTLPVVGDPAIINELRDIFIDMYNITHTKEFDLKIVSDGMGKTLAILLDILDAQEKVAKSHDKKVFKFIEKIKKQFKKLNDDITIKLILEESEELAKNDVTRIEVLNIINQYIEGTLETLSFTHLLSPPMSFVEAEDLRGGSAPVRVVSSSASQDLTLAASIEDSGGFVAALERTRADDTILCPSFKS